jgi:hypothetical protein
MASYYGWINSSSTGTWYGDSNSTAASGAWTTTSTSIQDSTIYYSPTYQRPTYYTYTTNVPNIPETAVAKAARLAREEEYRAQQKIIDEEKAAAIAKAEELLKDHIGHQRYKEFYHIGHIELDSEKYHGRKYRVNSNAHSRIEIIEDGKVIDELCIISTVECPGGDLLLSKIVMLESAEETALQVANHFRR